MSECLLVLGRLELNDFDVAPLFGHAEVFTRGVEQERTVRTLHLELDGDPGKRLLTGAGHDHLDVVRARGPVRVGGLGGPACASGIRRRLSEAPVGSRGWS